MKQPFNLSQEKIDQIFKHCLFDLDPILVSTSSMTYDINSTYQCTIAWRTQHSMLRMPLHYAVTDKLFSDNDVLSIIIKMNNATYAFFVSEFDFEEREKVKLEIYKVQKAFFDNMLEDIPCEVTPLESHPRIISGE